MGEAVGMYAPDPPPRQHRIPCPIHNGKDYNFSFTDKGFKCFVCGESGDVIDFVRLICNLRSRTDAMMQINRDFRLDLPFTREISVSENNALEERRRRAREREEAEQRLMDEYHAAIDRFIELDDMRRNFHPKRGETEIPLQYVYACKRIADARYRLDLACDALYRFEHHNPGEGDHN